MYLAKVYVNFRLQLYVLFLCILVGSTWRLSLIPRTKKRPPNGNYFSYKKQDKNVRQASRITGSGQLSVSELYTNPMDDVSATLKGGPSLLQLKIHTMGVP